MKMSKGQIGRRLLGVAVAGMALITCGAAFAELGQPAPWEYKLQGAATPVMESITWFHDMLLWIRAHCSACAPGGVSQRICQSP